MPYLLAGFLIFYLALWGMRAFARANPAALAAALRRFGGIVVLLLAGLALLRGSPDGAVVLAAGHQLEPDPTGKTSDVTVVTLLLTPEESRRAVLASSQGAIHFVLRNAVDSSHSNDTATLLSQLSGYPPVAPHAVAPMAAPVAVPVPVAPKHEGIETVLGGGAQ